MGTIQKNFLYNIVYQILVILLPLITAPYISRTLGATAVGVYSYTNSVAYYFLMVGMLGIANHGNRSVAAARDDQEKLNNTFSGIFYLQAFTFSVAIVSYVLYILICVKNNRIIASLQLLYVLSGLFDISWLFFGLEKFKLTVTRNMIIKLCTVLCMFVFVHSPSDLWKYTLLMSAGTLLSQLYLWTYVRKYVRLVKVPVRDILVHLKPVLVLFVPVLAYSIYKVMDKIMLGNIASYADVGYYQNAEKIINIPMGIITALGTVMLPRMSNVIANGDKNKSSQYIRVSIKLVTVLCSAIAFGLMGISEVLALVYLGEEFSPCAPIISLLSVTVFFIAWANVVRTQYLIPNHYDKIYLISSTTGAVVNLVINYMLIPQFKSNGAALGTIAAEFSVMVIQLFAVRKDIPVIKYIAQYFPVLVSGFFMMCIVRNIGAYLGNSILTLVIQVGMGGIVFCILVFFFFMISKDEMWIMIKNMICNILKIKK